MRFYIDVERFVHHTKGNPEQTSIGHFLGYNRTSPMSIRISRRRLLQASLPLLLTGCGANIYKERLDFTVDYYEYIDKLNRNLQLNPTGGEGFQLRVPLQFNALPVPNLNPNEDGSIPPDPRQPRFLDYELPGLNFGWQATLSTTDNPAPTEPNAFMYVVSNHSWWRRFYKDSKAAEPFTFNNEVKNLLGLISSTPANEIRTSTEIVPDPADKAFAPEQKFDSMTLVPRQQLGAEERELKAFMTTSGDIQAAIIMVYPTKVSGVEDIVERTRMMLQTFSLSSEKPRGGSAPSAGAAAPAPSTSGGF